MNFNKILQSLFGNKSTRDMKLIQPIVEKIKAEYPKMQALSNDELRAKTKELQKYVQEYAKEEKAKIAELKAKIEDTPIDEREGIFNQIDKLEQEALDKYEEALNEVLPQVFAIVKDTARRFAENEETIVTATDFDRELASNPANDFVTIDGDKAIYHNHWTAGGNDMKWEMIHYDVQLFGGVVLHQGKIAEMATGEGKTLVGTTPIFLNALTGNGVHVVTVNDYLAKRDSEWMGPLYMFHGLSVDCIDKHRPNSDERRKAYLADITFGTNNEFGFDYLRDNMATNPADLVQRQHNYAIVDEVDSVLIDDARTPLIISGPIPKGDDQMFEQYQPLVEKLYEVQRKQATELLAEAKQKINEGTKAKNQELLDEGFLALFRSYKALPKNKPLIKYLSEEGIKAGLLKTEEYYMANNNREMPKATEPLYFVVDEKMNSADLTDKGTDWLAKQVNDKELFVLPDITTEMSELEARTDLTDQERLDKKDEMLAHYGVQSERVHTLQQLLKGYTMFNKDDEYVVMDGQVKIVDEQTGRIMEGRRWSDGLHQAIEAKEHVKVEAATQTFATITLQNYFRMYHKLAGMTGTASTESGEFWDIYKLDVVEIPTNRPIQRKDLDDRVYKTAREKYRAVIDEIEETRNAGRPVLVGTTSVEISELLSKMLKMRNIPHNVLNAKLHQQEAQIVAEAGRSVNGKGAVTIATNMAGRGTDIILGGNAEYMAKAAMRKQGFTEELIEEATGYAETDDEEIINARNTFRELNDKYKEEIKGEAEKVREAGGLYIMGTERHESRRIDNQLRGRAGRQGDPGVSRFFLSTEDDLMRLFGGDRMKMMMERMNVAEDMPIENKMLTSIIEGSQEKVELRNFGIRKDVLQYDDVMNKQREIIYGQRNQVLNGEDLHETILKMVEDTIATSIKQYLPEGPAEHWNFQSLKDYYAGWLIRDESKYDFSLEDLENMEPEEIQKMLVDDALEIYKENEELLPEETIREMERVYLLKNVDTHWMDHIDNMDQLKSGIRLRSYGQHDPVVEYRVEGFDMFDEMIESIREDTVKMMLIMPKRVYEIQKRQDAIAAAKRAAQRAAAAAQSASDDEEAVEQSDAVKQALHREQVAQPTETSADGTDSVNKTIRKGKKIGRNDPCPCGSGKKYKKCCGRDL